MLFSLQIKKALNNFEFVVQGEYTDDEDKNCPQVKELIDQVVTLFPQRLCYEVAKSDCGVGTIAAGSCRSGKT